MRRNFYFIFVAIILILNLAMSPQFNIFANTPIKESTPFYSDNINSLNKINYEETKPNESGQIMILMYHGLDKYRATAKHQRTVQGFKDDLQKLYDNNYRLIKIEDLINNNINVEAGCTPVVLTFDDAFDTAFSLEEIDGELVPKKDCAVDIINNFSEAHPDFGKGGVFFVTVKGRHPFVGKGTMEERFKYLYDNGYEIGNHTFSHPHLYGLSEDIIQKELALVEKFMKETSPETSMVSMAYPFGERPEKSIGEIVLSGEFEDTKYNYKMALREGQSGASANPNHINFDPLNIPRVRGTNNAKWDLGWFIKYYSKNPENLYISDGNPKTISVPIKYLPNINMSSIGEKELIIY